MLTAPVLFGTLDSSAVIRCQVRAVQPTRRPMVRQIQSIVANYFELPERVMTDESRVREHARPRQIAMYLAREFTPRSLPEIGRLFGGRDHTTVMWAMKRVDQLRREDPEVAEDVMQLRNLLRARLAA